MMKRELIAKIASSMSTEEETVTQVSVRKYLDGIFETMANLLADGEEISISNFGIFRVHDTAPRNCRNPRTGESMEAPASRRVSFKPSSVLKAAVKGE